MRTRTRLAFNAMISQIALLNGVAEADVGKKFTVEPSIAQTLFEKVQLSSEFLSKINVVTVPQQKGQKVGIAIMSTIAGRTDTSTGVRRNPIDPSDTVGQGYECVQTNYDTVLSYAKLDMWAHRPEFQVLVRDAIVKRQGLDKMMIGWNGTRIAPTTDRVVNKLLQDVNKGWLQHVRDDRPDKIVSHGSHDAAKIYISDVPGAVRDYVNLDALVFDLIENLDEPFRDDTELVAICGRDLVHDKYFNIVNASSQDQAIQQVARDVLLSTKKIGGLQAVRVPSFPAGKLAITRLDNLSIYEQENTQRRMLWEQPDLDRIADFQSTNEAFVVEEYGLIAIAENIALTPYVA